MKKLICLLLAMTVMLFAVSSLAETAPAETLFTPGTYQAEAQGMLSTVKVLITVDETEIITVLIDATDETETLGGVAAGMLSAKIVEAQTPNVDAVSGATVTSNAVIKAATEALVAAGADIDVLDANRRDGGDKGSKEDGERTERRTVRGMVRRTARGTERRKIERRMVRRTVRRRMERRTERRTERGIRRE